MAKNRVISRETWSRLFAIKNYQEFIQEWLSLYDAFFSVNPSIPHELEISCMAKLFVGFGEKYLAKCKNNDDLNRLKDNSNYIIELLMKEINPYG